MKKVICLTLAMVFLFTCTMVAFADVDLVPSGVVSWDEVGEDAVNLANTYLNVLKSKSGKEFFKNVSEIPTSWLQTMSDGSWALSPVDDYYYFLKDGILQVGDKSGGGGSSEVTAPEDFYVPSDTVVNYIDYQNTLIDPKGKDLFIQSYRSENYYHVNNDSEIIPIFNDTEKTPFKDLYIMPFFQNENSEQFYDVYQYHLYYKPIEDPNADFTLQCDVYKYSPDLGNVLQSSNSARVWDFAEFQVPYCLGFEFDMDVICRYTLEQYTNKYGSDSSNNRQFSLRYTNGIVPIPSFYYPNGDLLFDYKGLYNYDFHKSYSNFNGSSNLDVGFVCSHSLIERTYKDIDTTKIPSNQVVNISGDTIYDYSITNPDTGASTSINEYVTNNYIYPEAPSTSEPSGGSGVGGNVNVGGNISVGGQVGVDINVSVPDININVNQGSGAGETGGDNVGDYIDTSGDVDVGGIIGKLPELSKGFTDYLRGFFTWLPTEIYGLIILILVISVWNVFRSRR